MKNPLRFAALVSALFITVAAHAADVVFPSGARVGIVPLDGLKASGEFVGFENDDKTLKVGVAEIPPAAFTAVETAFKEGKPVADGNKVEPFKTTAGDAYLTVESRKDGGATYKTYSVIAKGENFSAYLISQIRDGSAKAPSDADIRKMLATLTVRKDVPVDEQLSLLPFKVGELSGFKTVRLLAANVSVLLTDGTEETTLDGAPYIVIGTVPQNPATQDDRARFAEQAARAIPGLRSVRITTNEPIRIDSTPGFETRMDAIAGKGDTPVQVVQWLRFGSGATLRIIASSTKDEWPKAFPRFRAVRDGVAPK
ncbi:MAG: hypothetical protein J0I29_09620 [Rhizobiales bacterium]|nr:hypothetical protein [Hyphomicrobiales bacterium]